MVFPFLIMKPDEIDVSCLRANLFFISFIILLLYQLAVHGKNKYWEIYMTECSTLRYVQKLLKTGSTVLVQLDQQSWKKFSNFQKYSVESP